MVENIDREECVVAEARRKGGGHTLRYLLEGINILWFSANNKSKNDWHVLEFNYKNNW